jgi:hypothetical protein
MQMYIDPNSLNRFCFKCSPVPIGGYVKDERPPLGLMPRYIWELQRLEAIKEAVDRYVKAKKLIPAEWIEEYNELVGRLK